MRKYDENFYRFVLSIPIGKGTAAYLEAKKKFNYGGKLNSFKVEVSRIRAANKNNEKKVEEPLNLNPRGSKKKLTQDDLVSILKMKGGHAKSIELCRIYDCTPDAIIKMVNLERSKGIEIVTDDDYVFLSDGSISFEPAPLKKPLEDKEIHFGILSDLHFGSKACQITAINNFCAICKKEGVKNILVPGDLVAGYKVYKGQHADLYAQTAQEQESSVIRNLPSGFEWYVLAGNHDCSFISNAGGHNPITFIANKRKDIHYLGRDEAVIPLLNGVDCLLWHPGGGSAYAISYKLQKYVEQNTLRELRKVTDRSKDRPTLRFVIAGHYHTSGCFPQGSIYSIMAGCFEGSNSFTKRHGLVPQIGGWIIKAHLNRDGSFGQESFIPNWRGFLEIEEDHNSYNHKITYEETLDKPLFE